MSNLEKDPITLKIEEYKVDLVDEAERKCKEVLNYMVESNRKILDLVEENRRLKKRNDDLNEMNNLLLKEVIDDKNRFIKILEQQK